jgi:hypothetical protein
MKKNTSLYLLILSCILAVLILSIYLFNDKLYSIYNTYYSPTIEHFATENPQSNIIVNTCPGRYTQYTALNGDTLCCDGDVDGYKCSGTVICAVSSTNDSSIKSCKEIRNKYLQEQSKKLCPSTMTNYFENVLKKSIRGCTSGPINETGEAPMDPTQEQCKIYFLKSDAMKDKNSCYIKKRMDTMYSPKTTTGKSIIKLGNTFSPIASYTDYNGMPRQCYDKQSIKEYFNNITNKMTNIQQRANAEKNNENILNNHTLICEVAQQVFVERSRSLESTIN